MAPDEKAPGAPAKGSPEDLGLTKDLGPDTAEKTPEAIKDKGEPFDGNFA